MLVKDFHFNLPEHLIARYPLPKRDMSRLLVLSKTGEIKHQYFKDFLRLINPGDLLVFNNTRVIPARLFAYKPTGGKIEILLERILNPSNLPSPQILSHSEKTKISRFLAHVKNGQSLKPGSYLTLKKNLNSKKDFQLKFIERDWNSGLFIFEFVFESNAVYEFNTNIKSTSNTPSETSIYDILTIYGHTPLPPYISRSDELTDKERYQTVYATEAGAVAAPTAGLHFTEEMLEAIKAKGTEVAWVTLHVAAGTFQPIRVEILNDHKMHAEWMSVTASVCEKVHQTKLRGGRVIAVGTTSVRCLETAAKDATLTPYEGETRLFITPSFQFKVVDCLLTNFHLPESTLLVLVSAFAGKESVFKAYQSAIEHQYRFYSYGDAMFLQRADGSSYNV